MNRSEADVETIGLMMGGVAVDQMTGQMGQHV